MVVETEPQTPLDLNPIFFQVANECLILREMWSAREVPHNREVAVLRPSQTLYVSPRGALGPCEATLGI